MSCIIGPISVLRVLVLGRPEQGIKGAHLDTDPAVHAQRVVDVEAIEGGAGTGAAARRVTGASSSLWPSM